MKIIVASINLDKIDKSKIKYDKNGNRWFPITITVHDQKDKYENDVSITTGQTKDERDNKVAKVYLGNGQVKFSKELTNNTTTNNGTEQKGDDLPF
jgi:hypothetical protein